MGVIGKSMSGLKTATLRCAFSTDDDSPMAAQMERPTQSFLAYTLLVPPRGHVVMCTRADLHTPGLEEQLDTPLRVSLPSLLLL